MKKAVFLIFLIVISVIFYSAPFTVYAEEIPTHKVMHDHTFLYKTADINGEQLFELSQGTDLYLFENSELIASGIAFVKVKYGGYVGYVIEDGIYEIYPPVTVTITNAKIRSDKFGNTVSVYLAPNDSSEISYEIEDTTKVEKYISTANGFALISWEGKSGYIKEEYVIEKGLTQNEEVALILGCVGFVFLLAVLLLLGYSKGFSKKRKK